RADHADRHGRGSPVRHPRGRPHRRRRRSDQDHQVTTPYRCHATRSYSPAATVRTGTTSPRRTSALIPSAWSGRSTVRAATATRYTRKRSNPMPAIVAQTVDFLQEVRNEMRKITWPDRAQLRQATIAIIVFVLVI